MLTRFSDWEGRLSAFLDANAARRFAYGAFDCCLFAADAVLAMTGTDLAAEYRGQYASRREAALAMERRCGAASVEAVMHIAALAFGLERVGPRHVGRGDIVLVARRRACSLGIQHLSGRAIVIPFRDGLKQIEPAYAKFGWRI